MNRSRIKAHLLEAGLWARYVKRCTELKSDGYHPEVARHISLADTGIDQKPFLRREGAMGTELTPNDYPCELTDAELRKKSLSTRGLKVLGGRIEESGLPLAIPSEGEDPQGRD